MGRKEENFNKIIFKMIILFYRPFISFLITIILDPMVEEQQQIIYSDIFSCHLRNLIDKIDFLK